ncbi:hypothetical protein P3T36_005920 [Kitasatospora sp. MAP12-15]|uniref:DUF2142 domain-containing protein n=1 Tax=unclassified Kitasatospora TaxID=2633591 RepID=UPI002473FA03|nr:DUF2142 domain-containing protein [Kitasatospora sp. MAP12-44]MDH6111016.1 hypothetical protein [Kitasatospora sp. MAP12-44]
MTPRAAADEAERHPVPGFADSPTGRSRKRYTWLVAFLGFFFLAAGWALAAPFDGTPDEGEHVVRAYGVASGDFAPAPTTAGLGTGAFQTVPASLVRVNCWFFHPDTTAACAVPPGGSTHLVKTPTRAGRYNPVYYLVVGWPLLLWPTMKGVLAARLVSAALSAAMLAIAADSAVRWTRHRVMLAGVLAAVTPITLSLAGAVNPNGLEIAAGVALSALLIPILLDPEVPLRRASLVQVAVVGAVLMFLRALGPLWCVAIVGILLVPTHRALLDRLWRSKPARWATGAIVAAGLFGVAWTVIMKASQLAVLKLGPTYGFQDILRFEFFNRWGNYVNEMIGVMSWLDTDLPGPVYTIWYMVLGVLVVGALAFGTRTDRWRMFAFFAVTFGVPTVSEIMTVNQYGFAAQGRYMLPIAVAMPIFGAFVLGHRRVLNEKHSAGLTRLVAVVVVTLQLVFLWWTMLRWQIGQSVMMADTHLNPLAGTWHPEVGSLAPLLAAVLGAVLMIGYAWTSTRPALRPSEQDGAGDRTETSVMVPER